MASQQEQPLSRGGIHHTLHLSLSPSECIFLTGRPSILPAGISLHNPADRSTLPHLFSTSLPVHDQLECDKHTVGSQYIF